MTGDIPYRRATRYVAVSGNIDIRRACRTKQRDYRVKNAEGKFELLLLFSVSCYSVLLVADDESHTLFHFGQMQRLHRLFLNLLERGSCL